MRPHAELVGRLLLGALLSTAAAGCGDDPPATPTGPGGAGGQGGEGGAVAQALCPVGAAPDAEGCVTVGAAPCADGFEADDEGGCLPVLPPRACPDGEIALLGETTCRELAPCGAPPWGDIPVGPDTVYVDASYTGGDSDGTAARPFVDIDLAILDAPLDAVVAVAPGTYGQTFVGRRVRLWGICPELVVIDSSDPVQASLFINADGAEVRDLSVTGGSGIIVTGAVDVRLERLWIHDTLDLGLAVFDAAGYAAATASEVLVERGKQIGVFVIASDLVLERSVVRHTQPNASGLAGAGFATTVSPLTGDASTATIRNSIIEDSYASGIVLEGGQVLVERTAIRRTAPQVADGSDGEGINVVFSVGTGERASIEVRDSTIEDSHQAAMLVLGSDATIDGLTVRGVAPASDATTTAIGVALQPYLGQISRATARRLSTSATHTAGVSVVGSELDAELLDLRDGVEDGLLVLSQGAMGSAVVRRSALTGHGRAGVSSFGGGVVVQDVNLRCSTLPLDAETYQDDAASFEDLGGNQCGCDAAVEPCTVQSTNLSPPTPL